MSTLVDESPRQHSTTPAERLHTTMAAVRVFMSWMGTRKTLTAEQRAEAAEPFGTDARFLSAGSQAQRVIRGVDAQDLRSNEVSLRDDVHAAEGIATEECVVNEKRQPGAAVPGLGCICRRAELRDLSAEWVMGTVFSTFPCEWSA